MKIRVLICFLSFTSLASCMGDKVCQTRVEVENQSFDTKEIDLTIYIDTIQIANKVFNYYSISPSPYFYDFKLSKGHHQLIVVSKSHEIMKKQVFECKKETFIHIAFQFRKKSKEKIQFEIEKLGINPSNVDSVLVNKDIQISISDKIPDESM